ncbi:hypothetical protein BD311DRAFT_755328 [Dichomitus squalens]|uniref:Uncharacterized protein n=1 Tax=Dichomitus squalens TaxID=114155 RepID=A0A4Q9MV11_9APHY|nr:hypothetical protein BD311DRAFT_755328 [Dichomitus squalens]
MHTKSVIEEVSVRSLRRIDGTGYWLGTPAAYYYYYCYDLVLYKRGTPAASSYYARRARRDVCVKLGYARKHAEIVAIVMILRWRPR